MTARILGPWRSLGLAMLLGPASFLAAQAEGTAVYAGLPTNAFLHRWLVLGRIPVFAGEARPDDEAAQKAAFATDRLADHGGEAAVTPDPLRAFTVRGQTLIWRLLNSPADVVKLKQEGASNDRAVAYAAAEIHMPEAVSLPFGLGSDDALKVWLNGKVVLERWAMRPCTPDEHLVRLGFVPDPNRLVVKVLNGPGDWGFACRPIGQEILKLAEQGKLEVQDRLDKCYPRLSSRQRGHAPSPADADLRDPQPHLET